MWDSQAAGGRIRRERESRGWNLEELARRCGVSEDVCRRLEAGDDGVFTPEVLLRLSAQLEVTTDYLLSGKYRRLLSVANQLASLDENRRDKVLSLLHTALSFYREL